MGIDPRDVVANENWNKSSHSQDFDDPAFL